MKKRCPKCKVVKATSDFYTRPEGRGARYSRCKKCAMAESAAWAKANPERTKQICRNSKAKRRVEAPEIVKAQSKRAAFRKKVKNNLRSTARLVLEILEAEWE